MVPVAFAPGDRVSVRGRDWIVEQVNDFGECGVLTLAAQGERLQPHTCRILYPFDRPTAQKPPTARSVGPRRWMRVFHAHLSACARMDELRSPVSAAIDVLPFQLEPALAVIHGLTSRVLIADEVGLGKTIQAGILLAELRERGWCEHALILTPAGLRDQWCDELQRRFGIVAHQYDMASIAALAATLPPATNPWQIEPVIVASIDFVKQPEVLSALNAIWDLLIVDEAHQVATAPHRSRAVCALAERARQLVLLTATPHDGDKLPVGTFRVASGKPPDVFGVFLECAVQFRLLRGEADPQQMHAARSLRTYLASGSVEDRDVVICMELADGA